MKFNDTQNIQNINDWMFSFFIMALIAVATLVCSLFFFISINNNLNQIEKNTCVSGASSYLNGKTTETGCIP